MGGAGWGGWGCVGVALQLLRLSGPLPCPGHPPPAPPVALPGAAHNGSSFTSLLRRICCCSPLSTALQPPQAGLFSLSPCPPPPPTELDWLQ